jgi:signal transduction histidine kinase
MIAHAEVKRINENLENIVFERTKSLAEAHRELDTFLYRASHDLRSPVSSIIGLCNIALYLSDGETKELVMKVANTTEGMDKLLKKLSIISEINQPTNYSAIQLKEVVENVRDKFDKTIESLGVEFHSDCNDDVILHSYPNLVDVIITNLIENALFYSVMREPLHARVEFSAAIVDNHIQFSVYDNGIGVEEPIHHRLFDMFFKGNVDSKGNGLGLYIVQKSVQALEGNISVQSEPGRFTRFIVKLPLALVPKTEQEEVVLA